MRCYKKGIMKREQFGLSRGDTEGFMKLTLELDQRFSNGCEFAPQRPFSNVWRHFWLLQLGKKGTAIGIKWVETRDHAEMHRTAPQTKFQVCQVEKPWIKYRDEWGFPTT